MYNKITYSFQGNKLCMFVGTKISPKIIRNAIIYSILTIYNDYYIPKQEIEEAVNNLTEKELIYLATYMIDDEFFAYYDGERAMMDNIYNYFDGSGETPHSKGLKKLDKIVDKYWKIANDQ